MTSAGACWTQSTKEDEECSPLHSHPLLPVLLWTCREMALEKANFPDKLPSEPDAWVIAKCLAGIVKNSVKKGR